MSSKKDLESKANLEKCFKIVLQSSGKGISADEVAEKMGMHRTTVYGYLNSLQARGKVESKQGTWYAKTEQLEAKPLEKEIVIMLPLPKNLVQHVIAVEAHAKYLEDMGMPSVAATERIILEKIDETRSIRIKGKNVDDLDLEKLGNLLQQASQKSSAFSLKGLFKGFRKSLPNSSTINNERSKDAGTSSKT